MYIQVVCPGLEDDSSLINRLCMILDRLLVHYPWTVRCLPQSCSVLTSLFPCATHTMLRMRGSCMNLFVQCAIRGVQSYCVLGFLYLVLRDVLAALVALDIALLLRCQSLIVLPGPMNSGCVSTKVILIAHEHAVWWRLTSIVGIAPCVMTGE